MKTAILIGIPILTIIFLVVIFYIVFKQTKEVVLMNDYETMKKEILDIVNKRFEKGNIFQDIYVPNKSGELVKIEIVAVDNTGIYLFEPQLSVGKVYGACGERFWSCKFGENRTEPFENPVFISCKKKSHLKDFIGIHNKYMYSYIVFGDNVQISGISGRTRCKIYVSSELGQNLLPHLSVNSKNLDFKEKEMQNTLEKLKSLKSDAQS